VSDNAWTGIMILTVNRLNGRRVTLKQNKLFADENHACDVFWRFVSGNLLFFLTCFKLQAQY